jgi:hypothetical protein
MVFKAVGLGAMLYLALNEVAFAVIPACIPEIHPRELHHKEVVKLEPRIRETPTTVGIEQTISLENIKAFLKPSLILDNKRQYMSAPYVVAEDDLHMEGGAGSILYVQGIRNKDESIYSIYREGRTLCHPITHEILGFEALAIGTAELTACCETAQFKVLTASESIEIDSRLLPSYASLIPSNMTLRAANASQEGYILSARDTLDEIGINDVVIISLGQRECLQEGDVMEICQPNLSPTDPMYKGMVGRCKVKLPDKKIGKLLVFQTFEKASVALVIETTGPIHLLDKVRNP